ncbi:MAG: DUF4153 domain-containing protein [Nonlabens sp.]
MKRSIIIASGGLQFASLFYDTGLGLNTLLYSLWLVISLYFLYKSRIFEWPTVLAAVAMILTSIAITYHGSTLSITMYFATSITFIGLVASSNSSIYIAFMNGFYTVIFGMFHKFISLDTEGEFPKDSNSNLHSSDYLDVAKMILIPTALFVLFVIIYSFVNPVFLSWIEQIDLSIIDAGWIFTLVLGCLLMYHISDPQVIKSITEADYKAPEHLKAYQIKPDEYPHLKKDLTIGSCSIGVLNLLLVVVLISELLFIGSMDDSQKASEMSSAVHQGVYASITSIVVAIAIISYYFHGKLNFIRDNRLLKKISYLWIILNVLLIISVGFKNLQYIHLYGLSIKRLGVAVYLLVCLSGLITVWSKIANRRTITYLIRRNSIAAFTSIVLFSLINWAAVVTNYNLQHDFIHEDQLIRLYPLNALELQRHGFEVDVVQESQYYKAKSSYRNFIDRKWQDYNYTAARLKKHDDNE